VFAGGDGRVACTVGDGSSLMSAIYQLAASERLFYVNLDKIEQLFIQPLLQLGQTSADTPLCCSNVLRLKSSLHV